MLDSRRAKGLRLGLWCILAFLSLFAAERSAQLETRQAALRNALPDVLHTLALSSQVVNSRGPAIAGGLPVEIVQGAGEGWERDLVEEAVNNYEGFVARPSRHLLRVETIRGERGHALQLRLSRVNQDVMLPTPLQRRAQPYLFVLACLLGSALGWRSRRPGFGLVAAALLSFAFLALYPLDAPLIGYPRLTFELAEAPLWMGIVGVVARFERYLTAIVAAVVVFCALLAYFDHRGSREDVDSLSAPRILFDAFGLSVAALLLLESGTRSGWSASVSGSWGAFSAVTLIGACAVAFVGAKKQRAEA